MEKKCRLTSLLLMCSFMVSKSEICIANTDPQNHSQDLVSPELPQGQQLQEHKNEDNLKNVIEDFDKKFQEKILKLDQSIQEICSVHLALIRWITQNMKPHSGQSVSPVMPTEGEENMPKRKINTALPTPSKFIPRSPSGPTPRIGIQKPQPIASKTPRREWWQSTMAKEVEAYRQGLWRPTMAKEEVKAYRQRWWQPTMAKEAKAYLEETGLRKVVPRRKLSLELLTDDPLLKKTIDQIKKDENINAAELAQFAKLVRTKIMYPDCEFVKTEENNEIEIINNFNRSKTLTFEDVDRIFNEKKNDDSIWKAVIAPLLSLYKQASKESKDRSKEACIMYSAIMQQAPDLMRQKIIQTLVQFE
ncbi:MAG: hypothetical protein LBB11_02045 [Puniceicoccales bacterium]|nr:hypothetical protein [Puniceicoccales bacterium]